VKKLLLLVLALGGVLVVPLLALLVLAGTGNVAAACEPSAGSPTASASGSSSQSTVASVKAPARRPAPSATLAATDAEALAPPPPASTGPLVCQQLAIAAPPAGSMAKRALAWALAHVGDAYVAAAHGPHAWDCSTFTYTAYRQAGLDWPMQISYQQYLDRRHIQLVPLAQAQPGDLLFFDTNAGNSWYNPVTHVAMIIDPIAGTMVHAANPSAGVIISNYRTSSYYREHPPVTAPDQQGKPYVTGASVAGRITP
jgi:cell wall-associated NlpC family hydrolase